MVGFLIPHMGARAVQRLCRNSVSIIWYDTIRPVRQWNSGNTVYINTVAEYQTFSQGQKTHLSKQAFNHQSLALHEY